MQAMAAVEALGNQEAVFNINGSEFARVTAKDNQAAQNGLTTLQTILGGGTL